MRSGRDGNIDPYGRWVRAACKREPLDEAGVEAERMRVAQMILDRRARGVPPEGLDPEAWAIGNGGLYSYEIR